MTNSYPYVAPEAIRSLVGAGAFQRGRIYARTTVVRDLNWDAESSRLHASVAGSEPHPYRVDIRLDFADAGSKDANEGDPKYGDCTCPVGFNCKHVAATLLLSNDFHKVETISELSAMDGVTTATDVLSSQIMDKLTRAGLATPETGRAAATTGPSTDPGSPALSWQARLAKFAPETLPAPESQTHLALGFEMLQRVPEGRNRYRYSPSPIQIKQLKADIIPLIRLRPLMPGKRGNWIKGNLKWLSVAQNCGGIDFLSDQAEWFSVFYQLFHSSAYGRYAYDDDIEIGNFHSPRFWRMLTWAEDVGIPLIGLTAGLTVRRGESAQFRLDARAEDPPPWVTSGGDADDSDQTAGTPSLRLVPDVTIDGVDYPHGRALPIGKHGFAGLSVDRKNRAELILAPADKPLPKGLDDLLTSATPLEIPAKEIPTFFTTVYPTIIQEAPVVSSDKSIQLPELRPAQLRLDARFNGIAGGLDLEWSWQYYNPPMQANLFRHIGEVGRNVRRESTVIALVNKLWPTIGAYREEHLDGFAAANFSALVLPHLQALDEVTVHIDGDRPDYQELTADPHIKVTATETASNDWFDLGFEVTIDGNHIPFVDLFRALALGLDYLMLENGMFFSLRHQAFDKLRALLEEAESLAEWSSDDPTISRYQAGLWEELEEVADESSSVEAWHSSMSALTGIDSIAEVPVPDGLEASLRPYQVEGYRWLAFLHSHGLGGILADDMGLGKTMQTLALIAHVRETEAAEAASADADGTGTADAATAGHPPATSAPFLVVAPTSVVGNWAIEALKFTPGLTVAVVDATTKKRKTPLAEVVAGADIVITSYAVLRLDAEAFRAFGWAGLILDEAQFVKNPAAKVHQVARSIPASFRLAITGTPMENSLGDLWALSAIAAPGLFPSKKVFREEFVKPIESGEEPEKMERLRKRVRPFMLRRTKELVASELPAKQEQVLTVELEPKHRKLYDTVLQRERKKLLGLLGDMDKNRFVIFRSLTLLRMLALDPSIVDVEHEGVPSSKMEALLESLDDVIAEGHRTLVFSQFTSFLGRIAEELDSRGVDYAYLDGSTRSRADVIESFRSGAAPVFLISLKAGGFGLTLTEADYVFLMDPWWNPATENQAIDRAHRIGQTKNVMVYRLVAEGTIEEKVVELQQKKAELFSALMDNGDAFSSAITAADIRELLGGDA